MTVPPELSSCTVTLAMPVSPLSLKPLLFASSKTVSPRVSTPAGAGGTKPKSSVRFVLASVSPSSIGSPPTVRAIALLWMKPPEPSAPAVVFVIPLSSLLTLPSGLGGLVVS